MLRVVLPDGITSLIAEGLNEHVVLVSDAGTPQTEVTLKLTGRVEFAGTVPKSSLTTAGTPRVICTVPGLSVATLKSMLVSRNVAVPGTPGALAVTA